MVSVCGPQRRDAGGGEPAARVVGRGAASAPSGTFRTPAPTVRARVARWRPSRSCRPPPRGRCDCGGREKDLASGARERGASSALVGQLAAEVAQFASPLSCLVQTAQRVKVGARGLGDLLQILLALHRVAPGALGVHHGKEKEPACPTSRAVRAASFPGAAGGGSHSTEATWSAASSRLLKELPFPHVNLSALRIRLSRRAQYWLQGRERVHRRGERCAQVGVRRPRPAHR